MWHCMAVTKILDLWDHLSQGICLVMPYSWVRASLDIYHSDAFLGTVSSSGAVKNDTPILIFFGLLGAA